MQLKARAPRKAKKQQKQQLLSKLLGLLFIFRTSAL